MKERKINMGNKRNILGKACAAFMVAAVMVTGGFACVDADAAAESKTWDTFYISSNNKQMSKICEFRYHLGQYTARTVSSSGTGVGQSNLIQGTGGTVLDRASYSIKVSNSPKTFQVVSSGVQATYINSTLSFNVGSGTAHTTGIISHD